MRIDVSFANARTQEEKKRWMLSHPIGLIQVFNQFQPLLKPRYLTVTDMLLQDWVSLSKSPGFF